MQRAILFFLLLGSVSGCASVPTSIEPIPYGAQEHTGTVWADDRILIMSIDGRKSPRQAEGSWAETYAVSLKLQAGSHVLSLWDSGEGGVQETPIELTVKEGHAYRVKTRWSSGAPYLTIEDLGYGSSCTGEFKRVNLYYVQVVTCSTASGIAR